MRSLSDVDFSEYLDFVGSQESQFFVDLTDYSESIAERFAKGVTQYGDRLPWRKTYEKFRLRPGEVSLWGGINGHGKSLLLSHVCASLMSSSRVLIASLEMPIQATGHRLVRQMLANSNANPQEVAEAISFTTDRLWIYDQLDTVESDRILGMCAYAFRELQVNHVVIDSLMKCGVPGEDYDRQKNFVDRLCWIAKTFEGHIHLVHHVRKGQNEEDVPDKFDIKGSGAIADLVDNLVIIHRNLGKERAVERGDKVDVLTPDTVMSVAKQRHGEWQGRVALYFHPESQQYLSGPDNSPYRYGIDETEEYRQWP